MKGVFSVCLYFSSFARIQHLEMDSGWLWCGRRPWESGVPPVDTGETLCVSAMNGVFDKMVANYLIQYHVSFEHVSRFQDICSKTYLT